MAVVAVVAALAGWRWWHNRPPYGPEALDLRSSLTFVTYQEAQAALGAQVHAPVANDGDQLVLGRVSWQAPPKPLDGGWFAIFLIDKRNDRRPGVFGLSAPRTEALSIGSHGAENRIPERYPWLRGAGDVPVGDGTWRGSGNRVGVFDEAASPLTFVARFPHLEAPAQETLVATAPVAMSDLLLALAYLGPDGQVYWAQRLSG
ncbi:hypothetical protein AB0873_28650 [Micromonospora sp. NPDC047707]|uniref:hypothetical protein n=1 Tax=Micromonospora sp. NPDC047707 TaxID=3154498 RepID=UPI003456F458